VTKKGRTFTHGSTILEDAQPHPEQSPRGGPPQGSVDPQPRHVGRDESGVFRRQRQKPCVDVTD
jgi:hypothetical protein